MAHLTSYPIQLDALIHAVLSPSRGGVATFLGMVRDQHAGRSVVELGYEAYGPMAEAECARIVAEAETRWPVRVAVQHRVGTLVIGDTAVAIAAAGAHRDEAFEACRYVIEELKRRVPIWKRERYSDGSEAWVDPTAPGGTVPAMTRAPE
ncbi:MAG TPA: molybdenum cofactor biosynthesis protein MoaE [Gemmatimonadales bacterium]|nr:molybdenum cofactor biosynthesis protein MoaE [Gemmatimonadales bacterium]